MDIQNYVYQKLGLKSEVIKTKRKTLTIAVSENEQLIIKAPLQLSDSKILEFIIAKSDWISDKAVKMHNRNADKIIMSDKDKKKYIQSAREAITYKADKYSSLMNVSYNRIAIREQRTRWGSCSSNKNLNFNWKLILMPEEVMDYVIIHELAHLKHMNHSKEFWNCVAEYCPNYKVSRKWLKEQ